MEKTFCYIVTPTLGLLPYLREFLPVYHEWMQDKEILELTASESLTLEEEQENQASWLSDPSKYTFIVFHRNEEGSEEVLQQTDFPVYSKGMRMAGDINLFFHAYLEDDEAEINVMIGEYSARKKGLAKESVKIMMDFGCAFYNRTKFIAKISSHNAPSIALFEKLGFTLFADVVSFDEKHFSLEFTQDQRINKEQFAAKYAGYQPIDL